METKNYNEFPGDCNPNETISNPHCYTPDINDFTPEMIKGLMPKRGGGRHPYSRDWAFEGAINCDKENCIANRNKKCIAPSLIKIDFEGKCKGYKSRV